MQNILLEKSTSFKESLKSFPSTHYKLPDPVVYEPDNLSASIAEVVKTQHSKKIACFPETTVAALKEVTVNPNGSILDNSGDVIEESAHDFLHNMSAKATERKDPQIENGILLFKYGYNNYGHWLVEMLPKLHFLRLALKEHENYKYLIGDVSGSLKDIVYSTLAQFGIHNESIYQIKQSTPIKNLIYCSPITKHPYLMHPDIRAFYDIFPSNKNSAYEKLFVTRPGNGNRIPNTITEIENLFDQAGFKIVEPGNLNFSDQIEMFRGSNVVAGVAGAAMTNTIFCPKNTKVLHIVPPSMPNLFFYQLASICNHSYAEYRAESDNNDMFGNTFDVNVDKLRNALGNFDASFSNA